MDWEEFLTKYVNTWRDEFGKLSVSERETFLSWYTSHYHFLEPIQIEVIDFAQPRGVIWIITRDKDRNDMEFIVHSNVKESLQSFLDRKKVQDPTWFKKFEAIIPSLLNYQDRTKWREGVWSFADEITFCFLHYNPLEKAPVEYARSDLKGNLSFLQRNLIREDIQNTARQIESDADQIPDKNLRSKFLESTRKLQYSLSQIKRIDEYERKLRLMEEEIGGVRKMIGVSKEYQDWRLLASDVSRLKGEHVPREVFDSKVRELSTKIEAFEKIEKAYERLSSQQEKVLEQQSSFLKWIKYSTILVPIAVACIPIIEIIVRHILGSL